MELTHTTSGRFESSYGAAVQAMDRGLNLRPQNGAEREASANDSVNVSQDALLFTEALRGAHNAPDVRADRVAALREKICNGAYEIDTRELAFNILRDEAFFSRL